MVLKIKTSADIPSSEITPEHVYRNRREFLKAGAIGAAGLAVATVLGESTLEAQSALDGLPALKSTRNPKFVVDEAIDPITSAAKITTYNNYYEFGTRKDQPAINAHTLHVKPWTVKVDGLVDKPGDY